jgi:hypothetical protein
MTFSIKRFDEVFLPDGKLDKQAVMKASVSDFSVGEFKGNLEKLGAVFRTNVVYSNMKWKNNYRLKDNANLKSIDIMLLDIDNGLTIEEVLKIPFALMCLTTTSHTPEKPKFRVFLPLLEPIEFLNNEEYKELMELISETYFSGAVDKATMEIGRAYISTTRAESFVNNSSELLDPTELLVKVRRNLVLKEFAKLVNTEQSISLRTRPVTIEEVLKYPKVKALIKQLGDGNNYLPVYKIMGISKKAGLSDENTADLILSLNIGSEYSERSSLLKKNREVQVKTLTNSTLTDYC